MNELEELQSIMKLLKKYELPISPILEYAIEEKIDQISLKEEAMSSPSATVIQESDKNNKVDGNTKYCTKKKPLTLRVVRSDGTVLEGVKSADTFCKAIKEIGVDRVYSLKIPHDSMWLVTIGRNPKYSFGQHEVGNGYYINVHSNTGTKKRQLEKIFKGLGFCWKVEITETD